MCKYPANVPLRVCVAGVTGWTGSAVAEAIEAADDLELVAGVSRSDPASFSTVEEALDAVPTEVLVDYTHADAVKGHVLSAFERAGTLLAVRAVSERVGLSRGLDQLL
jgi:4-hydroxy-tetrahydrodipicolinate reductase